MSIQNQPVPTIESHRAYRFGFFWPVVLIALGIILLLNNINVLPGSAWEWVWRLWPVVFLAMGLDSILRREFVGATLMIGLGGLFLAINFGYLALNVWEVIIRLWPLFLISAGLSLIFDRRWLRGLGSLIGVVVILAILAGSVALVNGGAQAISWQIGQTLPSQKINQPLNGAKAANMRIEPATGVLTIKALSESSALVDGTVNLQGNERLVQTGALDGATANYVLRSDGAYVGFGPSGNEWHNWNLRLAPDLPMVLNVKMAAGETNLDLSGMQVTHLNVDMAVGSSTITMPRDTPLIAKVSNAIGSLNVIVPPGTAIKIIYSGALSTIDMPPGFVHSGAAYVSPNYDGSTRRIDLYVSQAIGTLSVHEQTGL
jgi:hypothetical protein